MKGKHKELLEMNHREAKCFFMKSESYFNANLPDYIDFDEALKSADSLLTSKKNNKRCITDVLPNYKIDEIKKYWERDDLNYEIIMNKNGDYSWRPLVLIHPILYVDIVNYITEESNWIKILERFKVFQNNNKINCYSLPVEALKNTKQTDLSATVLNWWNEFEQASIEKSIKYEYAMHTDIADCYPSIYTHSISWALHGKTNIKKDPDYGAGWLGSNIDQKIARMQNNQTNGIPQGSVLMDFIAEIVLGYVDLKLSQELNKLEERGVIKEYEVARYRDDYRIYSNDINQLENITRVLSDVLHGLNFKLNNNKTKLIEDIIIGSIKPDKLYWNQINASFRQVNPNKKITYNLSMQKHLLEIKKIGDKFPNSGMLKKSLTQYYQERVDILSQAPNDSLVLIGILVDIMIRNPNSLSHCVVIIGRLLKLYNNDVLALEIIKSILERYQSRSNTEYLTLWLQRLAIMYGDFSFNELRTELTDKIEEPDSFDIFPIDWIKSVNQSDFKEGSLVNLEIYNQMKEEIKASEIDDFNDYRKNN